MIQYAHKPFFPAATGRNGRQTKLATSIVNIMEPVAASLMSCSRPKTELKRRVNVEQTFIRWPETPKAKQIVLDM